MQLILLANIYVINNRPVQAINLPNSVLKAKNELERTLYASGNEEI